MTGYVLPLRKYKMLEVAFAASSFFGNNYTKHTKTAMFYGKLLQSFVMEQKTSNLK